MTFIKFPKALVTCLCIALLANGQAKDFSQEAAEATALNKYLTTHKLLDSLAPPAPAVFEAYFGAHVQRSATLLATSTAQRRHPVKVIIYGQSITGSKSFTENIALYLKEHFPYADVSLENRSIGGFGASQIIRTAPADLYNSGADLIIFHVYGGEKTGELEELFSNVRKYMTADVLLMSHHTNGDRKKPDEQGAQHLRYIANKYDLELVDISAEWPPYLEAHNLQPKDLLRDNVHPNPDGNWLLAQLIGRHIRYNPLYPSGWYKNIQTFYTLSAFDKGVPNAITFSGEPWKNVKSIAVSNSPKSNMKLTFYGNRVDVIGDFNTPSGTARILVDGKPLSKHPGLLTFTRPTPGPGTWWPGIRRVTNITPLQPEEWTLKIESVNADTSYFTYSVRGSKTGADGTGNSKEVFTSKSGRVVIDPSDVLFEAIKKTFKVAIPVGFTVTWSVVPLCGDTFHSPVMTDKNSVYKTTLVKGLPNGKHTLELIPVGDTAVMIQAFEVHRPALEN